MPTLSCEACGIPFTILAASDGQKLSCPHCGDVNIYRAPRGTTNHNTPAPPAPPQTPADPAAAREADTHRATPAPLPSPAAPPPTAARVGEPERDVLSVHPVMFRARPLAFSGLVLAVLAGGVGAFWLHASGPMWTAFAAGIASLAALATLGIWKLLTLGERLTVTNKRVRLRRGLLGRSSTEMLHRTIQDIEVQQSFFQRLFKSGTLRIANSGEEGDDIRMDHAPDPVAIQRTIDSFRPM